MMRAASWALAVGAAVALTTGLCAVSANRAVFSSDGFADRTDAALRSDAVSAEVARRLTMALARLQCASLLGDFAAALEAADELLAEAAVHGDPSP